MILFGNRAHAEAIKVRIKMRPYCVRRALNPTRISSKRQKRTPGDMRKTETGVVQPQAKELRSHPEVGGGEEAYSTGSMALPTAP